MFKIVSIFHLAVQNIHYLSIRLLSNVLFFSNYKMPLDHYSNKELHSLTILSEGKVIIDPLQTTRINLKINPRFDPELQEGHMVHFILTGKTGKNLELISKSKVLPNLVLNVEIKNTDHQKSRIIMPQNVLGTIKEWTNPKVYHLVLKSKTSKVTIPPNSKQSITMQILSKQTQIKPGDRVKIQLINKNITSKVTVFEAKKNFIFTLGVQSNHNAVTLEKDYICATCKIYNQ